MRRVAAAAFALIALPALAAETQSFGKPLTGLAPTPLREVLAQPKDGARVCLEGSVAAVCQNKGCWLELKQGDQAVHVTFEGYSFFVPKDSKGRAVRLEGKVSVQSPDPGHVEHMRKEGAGESAAAKVSIVASGVELK
jgi:hypothetical protein